MSPWKPRQESSNRLLVADLTYVKTFTGWVYVAFFIDVFSRRFIVGWQISTSLRSDLAIDAIEMAIYSRNGRDLWALIHHSDRECSISRSATPSDSVRPRSSRRSARRMKLR
jgi:transposase InsO family protein